MADLNLALNLADSAFTIRTSGVLHAQLNKLNLVRDTLSVETGIEASLTIGGRELESELKLRGFTLASPLDTAVVQELIAGFKADSLRSRFQADADFFHADLHALKPLNELDSLGKGYQNYFASFQYETLRANSFA